MAMDNEQFVERRAQPQQQQQPQPVVLNKGDTHDLLYRHAEGCPAHGGIKDVQKEIQELWKKVTMLEILDHRVTAIEDSLTTIEAAITSTNEAIHRIQTSMAESNVVHLWTGRIVIAALSAAVSFLSAKYA